MAAGKIYRSENIGALGATHNHCRAFVERSIPNVTRGLVIGVAGTNQPTFYTCLESCDVGFINFVISYGDNAPIRRSHSGLSPLEHKIR